MPLDPARGVAGPTGATVVEGTVADVATAGGSGAYIGRRGSASVPCPTIGTIAITRWYVLRQSTRGCAKAAPIEASRHTTGITALRTFMRFTFLELQAA